MAYTLSENIRQLRVAHGMNQVQFAHRIGVTKQCVSNWENGNVLPSIEMLVRLAELFCVSTDRLLGREAADMLDVSDLTVTQRAHISMLVNDLAEKNKRSP